MTVGPVAVTVVTVGHPGAVTVAPATRADRHHRHPDRHHPTPALTCTDTDTVTVVTVVTVESTPVAHPTPQTG